MHDHMQGRLTKIITFFAPVNDLMNNESHCTPISLKRRYRAGICRSQQETLLSRASRNSSARTLGNFPSEMRQNKRMFEKTLTHHEPHFTGRFCDRRLKRDEYGTSTSAHKASLISTVTLPGNRSVFLHLFPQLRLCFSSILRYNCKF
jgi:hypothetical protein